jgi:hypothetical protein
MDTPEGVDTAQPEHWPPERVRRFWRFVHIGDARTCWPWIGNKLRAGFGRYRFRMEGKTFSVYAHRAAWALTNGNLSPRIEVYHRCSNLACCNPDHLGAGTAADRGREVARRGQKAGERHHGAKLTAEQVLELRALKAAQPRLTAREVAPRFGLSATRVQAIWRGEGWRNVFPAGVTARRVTADLPAWFGHNAQAVSKDKVRRVVANLIREATDPTTADANRVRQLQMDLVMQLYGRLSPEDIQRQVIEPALRKRGVTACARDAVVAACTLALR